MFDDIKLLGERPKKIVVQTKKGTDLDAFIGPSPSPQCARNFNILTDTFGKNWETRKSATGGYNCAGMVWCTRRAVLSEPADWKRILKEDDYNEIDFNQVNLDDIIVYFRKSDDEISHVGRICKLVYIETLGKVRGKTHPRVLSKWDLTSGESIHAVDDIFLEGGISFYSKFYTDRKI